MLGDKQVIKVVFIEGAIGDWAAYAGPGYWETTDVAERGQKLARETAILLAREATEDISRHWLGMSYRD
mgnify:CR=1 FL=1